jgi:DNA-binding response OmpR family regulator
LDAILYSRDPGIRQAFTEVMRTAGIRVDVAQTGLETLAKFAKAKFDALIIDLDGQADGREVLEALRKSKFNHTAIAFAVVKERSEVKDAYSSGANFVLQKPVSREALTRCVRAAHGLIQRERRRYFRHPVDVPLFLVAGQEEINAMVVNVSENGIGVVMSYKPRTKLEGRVKLRFVLPEGKVPIEGNGEVAWTGAEGRLGIHITQLTAAARKEMDDWLNRRLDRSPLFLSAAQGYRAISSSR